MAFELRRVGKNIENAFNESNLSFENFCNEVGLSENDAYRLFQGRLILHFESFKKVSKILNKPVKDLLNTDGDYLFVEPYGKFSDLKNQDLILDIIDDYIDLIEVCGLEENR